MNLDFRKILEKSSEYIFLFLLAYMPLYVLLSTWIGTSIGSLDAIKASKEVLLVFGFLLALGTTKLSFIKRLSKDKLVWLITLYAALTVLMALVKPTDQDAEVIAVVYNLRFLLFFLYAGLLMTRLNSDFIKKSIKIVLFSGIIVALFGIFQVTLLPNDTLSNIGYSRENGTPAAFFISDETQAVERAYSTIKDPNALGSYLIIICSFAALFLVQKWPERRQLLGGMLLLSGLCLLLTHSRSAWVGAFFAATTLILLIPKTRNFLKVHKKKIAGVATVAILVIFSGLFIYRDSSFVQNTIFHVGDDSSQTSNSIRADSIERTTNKIFENPAGYGPGTAGPASLKNDVQGGLVPENYYLQIAHEVGVIGIGLFIAICAITLKRLFVLSNENDVARALIAAFIGITIANLFVHIWFNEAVAYTWWGLAGLAVGSWKIASKKS